MLRGFRIGSRRVGSGAPVLVVAEMSANHHGRYEEAAAIVRAAAESGADAVKLQTYTADTMTLALERPPFLIEGTIWNGRTLHGLYREAATPWEWHRPLQAVARGLGVELFSTPFDTSAVDFLQELDLPAYKVASFELVDLPLLRRVAATGKPVIVSTGMATIAEIEEAVVTLHEGGCTEVVLLRCSSAYPAHPESMDLATIPHMSAAFGLPVGISDHTLGIATSVAAVALGACVVEKHFTLSRSQPGVDSAFSLEPAEFRALVEAIRVAEKAVGVVRYGPTDDERPSRALRRSLFVVRDVRAGEPFTPENVRAIRPGHGLHTRYLPRFLARKASRDIPAGSPLAWEHLGG